MDLLQQRGGITLARGQSQAADAQLNQTNAVAGSEGDKASKLEGQLTPGYTSLMDTGYLNPQEENAAVTSEMGSATAPFQTAGFDAKNTAGATRNAADLTANQDQLALEEGRTAGTAAAGLQKEKMQNQEAGMYGLQGLQSGDQKTMAEMYGLGPSTLQARAAGTGHWGVGVGPFDVKSG